MQRWENVCSGLVRRKIATCLRIRKQANTARVKRSRERLSESCWHCDGLQTKLGV